MRDVTDQLSGFDDGPQDEDLERAVHDVLVRGQAGLRRRRVQRSLAGAGAVLAVGGLASAVYLATTPGTGRPDARASVPTVGVPTSSAPTPTDASTNPSRHAPTSGPRVVAPAAAVKLVAYSGHQLPGYTITHVPQGYVLQGISNAVLDVARKGDDSPLDSFVGKLVVMLNDHPGPKTGARVSVGSHPGRINRGEDKVAILTYNDGQHEVDVQCWSNIHLTDAQLVKFAEGVRVLSTAATARG